MAPMVSVIEIARPPGEVFSYVTDPARFPQWQRDVVSVSRSGSRFVTTRRIGGVERVIVQQIDRSDPPHSWAASGVEGPIRPHAAIAVEPLDGGARSRVTFTLDFEAHGIGVALLPLVRRQTRRSAPKSYQNLKRLLE
ncbi:hypothetical protein Rhe02_37330 [Rhizocola hellebori]|uniref:SRPBCC family protein n=1 Tax=Rhizocola hellebori TaxID=1392758 RepID=A0A8J3VH49_9ACTN|nr:SRPBCC family protein [Rhizocola hellebori]GIH05666.1 hypothetical protein Rhe02_37330 [Rhizocola hellebori]